MTLPLPRPLRALPIAAVLVLAGLVVGCETVAPDPVAPDSAAIGESAEVPHPLDDDEILVLNPPADYLRQHAKDRGKPGRDKYTGWGIVQTPPIC